MYLYAYVSLLAPVTMVGPSDTMVPRLDMCRSIISLSRITHQMGHYHPFNQHNKAAKTAVGMEVAGGWSKFEKGGR